MSNPVRLDSMSSPLANASRQSAEPQQRRAVLAACTVAVVQTGLRGDVIDTALESLRLGDDDRSMVRPKLSALSDQLDEQYLDLYERADQEMTPEALYCFRQARAASALALGLSPTPEKLHEAVYEAIIASEKQAETLQAAETALKT